MPKTLRPSDLSSDRPTRFELSLSKEDLREISQHLDLIDLRKLRFDGEFQPRGKTDWAIQAHLGATVVQPCSITLDPVTTRIEEPVERLFVRQVKTPEDAEFELDSGLDPDPLPEIFDLKALMLEALALAIPPFPRAKGANLESAQFAAEGIEPMTDEATKPFAGLAALKEKLEKGD